VVFKIEENEREKRKRKKIEHTLADNVLASR
jgi:hypothetical protein